MDEFMIMEYLRSKGINNMSEEEFTRKFKEFMFKYGDTSYMRNPSMEDMDDIKFRRSPMRMHQDYHPYSEYSGYMNEPYSRINQDRFYNKYNKSHSGVEYPMNTMNGMNSIYNEHFDEEYAKYIVSNMYHIESGKQHTGEKFSMMKAKEIRDKYRGIISNDITVADVYVAINAQYHDYCELFKTWFSTSVENKIIESAIVFWFKDNDYDKGFKLMEYFK